MLQAKDFDWTLKKYFSFNCILNMEMCYGRKTAHEIVQRKIHLMETDTEKERRWTFWTLDSKREFRKKWMLRLNFIKRDYNRFVRIRSTMKMKLQSVKNIYQSLYRSAFSNGMWYVIICSFRSIEQHWFHLWHLNDINKQIQQLLCAQQISYFDMMYNVCYTIHV